MDTLLEQIKTELIWDKMILSIETLSIFLNHSLEFLECSNSGVRIEIGGFSVKSSFTNLNFLCVFFLNESFFNGEKHVWILMWVKKLKFVSIFSQFCFWLSPNKGLLFKAALLAGNLRMGTWWKFLGC